MSRDREPGGGGGLLVRRWKTVLGLLPLGLLGAVVWRERPWNLRLSPDAPWLMVTVLLLNFTTSLPLKAARWRLALTNPPPFCQVLTATIEGLLGNAAIGFGSGDLVRALRLEGRGRQLALDYACTWAERGAELLALAILVLVTAWLADLGPLAWGLSAAGGAGYLALLGIAHRVAPHLSRWPRAQEMWSAALRASTLRRVAGMVALSLLGWASEVAMLILFQRAFHLDLSARTALLTLVGINAAIAIPAVPGNFGTYEAGAAIGLSLSGVPRDLAIAFAVAYHLIHVIPVAVVAAALAVARALRRPTAGIER